MSLMNDIKGGGHSLVAPKMSIGWGVYAMFAIIMLAIFAGIGLWLYGKVKSATGLSGKMGASISDQSGMGSLGNLGWL